MILNRMKNKEHTIINRLSFNRKEKEEYDKVWRLVISAGRFP